MTKKLLEGFFIPCVGARLLIGVFNDFPDSYTCVQKTQENDKSFSVQLGFFM